MMRLREILRKRPAVFGAVLLCAGSIFLVRRFHEPSPPEVMGNLDFPELFSEAPTCPQPRSPIASGRRSEELGRLRADRYMYSPRDGVIAVTRFGEAAACYQAAGADRDAGRAERAARALTRRVNTDYAAARLNLFNALQNERWSDALGEIRRLLLLTKHMRRHEYVEWLEKNIGRVAARAGSS